MRLAYAYALGRAIEVPTPRDQPRYRSGEADPHRVLLLGNGPTHGWGVVTHGQALTGQLALAVGAVTGRGCDVDYVGEEMMSLATARDWLGARDLAAYDAVVLVLSLNDAVRLTPEEQWQVDLRALLDHLVRQARPNTPIVFAGVRTVASSPLFDGLLAWVGQRHADRLNRLSGTVAAEYGTVVPVDLGPAALEPGRAWGSPRTYRAWADQLAAALPPLAPPGRSTTDPLPEDRQRPATRRILAAAGAGEASELDAIAAEAKTAFGVDLALITLVDGDRQYFPTGHGSTPQSVPLHLTYCDTTVRSDEPLVVPNQRRDARFRDNPYLDHAHLRFYAGQPLRDAEGDVVGTICLMSALPRAAASVDLHRLGAFAIRAERELDRLADAAGTGPRAAEAAAR